MQDWEVRQNEDLKLLGLRPHPGSGNKWYLPSDGSDGYFGYFQAEHKGTNTEKIQMQRDVLDKITREALQAHKRPLLVINVKDEVWAGVRDYVFDSMAEVAGIYGWNKTEVELNRTSQVSWTFLTSLAQKADDRAQKPCLIVSPKTYTTHPPKAWKFTTAEVFKFLFDKWKERHDAECESF